VVGLAYVRVEHEATRPEMWVEGAESPQSAYLA
jgi:hypothetical protein